MTQLPLHIDSDYYDLEDGQLMINGHKAADLYATSGVPLYAYDSRVIDRRLNELRAALPEGIELHYAMKANPMPEVVHRVAKQVDGLDVASAGELAIAIQTDVPRLDISFAGPGKGLADLHAAIDAGIVLNIESELELKRISDIAQEKGVEANVAVRVNPDFELKNSGMRMSGGPKQFGIDAERVPDVLAGLDKLPVKFQGLHIFTGSQNLKEDAIAEAQCKSMDLAIELCSHIDAEPSFINIGGGFGIPYFPGDERLSLDNISENLARVQAQLRAAYANCRVVLELGRYMIGEAGVYLSEITDIKYSRGHRYLIVNGGLHHHLSASGNFGQVIRKNYPVAIANKMMADEMEVSSVVGPLCTPLDLLADKMPLPANAEVGDVVAVFQSGAYGYSSSPHLFLGHGGPQQRLV